MLTKTNIYTALKAAHEASAAILKIYHSGIWEEELKDDKSPLTLADRTAHQIIMSELRNTNIPVLSEEGKSIPFETRKNWDYFWLVDPLDGTKEFLKRNGEFTVNIALVHKNKPIWGVVVAPALNRTWYVNENGNVLLENEKGEIQELKPRLSPLDLKAKGIKVVASRSHIDNKTEAFLSELKEPETVSMGSSLKFMMIAEQKADVYPRYAPTSEWDTAAAHAILNALGYKVFKEGVESELEYNKENILNPGFLVK